MGPVRHRCDSRDMSSSSPLSFAYEACDIPAGMTVKEWQREKARAAASHRPAKRDRLRALRPRRRTR